MSKKSLKLGVVGVGKLGEFHTKLLREISEEQVEIILSGVFDLNTKRATEMAKKYSTNVFNTLEELAAECDAVVIATTTSSHHVIATKLLEQQVHVFIEKPITRTVEEADELIEIAKKNNCLIQVGHIERFNPAIQAIESEIGKPIFITAERLSGFSKRVTDVSVILDLMIHDIDLVLSLVKAKVQSISASGISVFSEELDMAIARLEFENGAVANVSASRISRKKERKMRFFCTNPNSYASLDLTSGKAEVFRIVDQPMKTQSSLKEFATEKIISLFGDIQDALGDKKLEFLSPEMPKINALKCELESFINSIQNGVPAVVTAEEGRQALDVAIQITEKIKESQALFKA